MLDGSVHVGTFCDDGTFSLPLRHRLHLWSNTLTLIKYSLFNKGHIRFSHTAYALRRMMPVQGVINPCYICTQSNACVFGGLQIDGNTFQLQSSRPGVVIFRIPFSWTPIKYVVQVQWFYVYKITQNCRLDRPLGYFDTSIQMHPIYANGVCS